jgi:hypothetical protein
MRWRSCSRDSDTADWARLLGLGGSLLEIVKLRREVHSSSICCVQYRSGG